MVDLDALRPLIDAAVKELALHPSAGWRTVRHLPPGSVGAIPDYLDYVCAPSVLAALVADVAELREILRRERQRDFYWLLRCYDAGHRHGWEPGPNTAETMSRVHDFLCNAGLDPNTPETRAWMKDYEERTEEPK